MYDDDDLIECPNCRQEIWEGDLEYCPDCNTEYCSNSDCNCYYDEEDES